METIECPECSNMLAVLETSKELNVMGEMYIVIRCPNKRCKALVRLPLISYSKVSK